MSALDVANTHSLAVAVNHGYLLDEGHVGLLVLDAAQSQQVWSSSFQAWYVWFLFVVQPRPDAFKAPLASLRFATTAAQQAEAVKPSPSVASMQATEQTLGDDQPSFDTLAGKVSRETLSAISSVLKIQTMSPVQAAVLPLLPALAEPYDPESKNPRDLLVKAKTGTGKTLGFLIPLVEARMKALKLAGQKAVEDAGLATDRHLAARAIRMMARSEAGALIISPTRELATQIANEAIRLTSHHQGFEVRLFVGGANKGLQMRDWHRGRRDIVVATPGRLRDFLENESGFADCFKNTPFVSFHVSACADLS